MHEKLKWYAESQICMEEDRNRIKALEEELGHVRREAKNLKVSVYEGVHFVC